MGDLKVVIDDAKLKKEINEASGTKAALEIATNHITSKANSIGSGYRTGKYHRDHKSPAVGGTQPKYVGDVKMGKKGPVGIVHPKNYAAMKDNHLHNTLLKSL